MFSLHGCVSRSCRSLRKILHPPPAPQDEPFGLGLRARHRPARLHPSPARGRLGPAEVLSLPGSCVPSPLRPWHSPHPRPPRPGRGAGAPPGARGGSARRHRQDGAVPRPPGEPSTVPWTRTLGGHGLRASAVTGPGPPAPGAVWPCAGPQGHLSLQKLCRVFQHVFVGLCNRNERHILVPVVPVTLRCAAPGSRRHLGMGGLTPNAPPPPRAFYKCINHYTSLGTVVCFIFFFALTFFES